MKLLSPHLSFVLCGVLAACAATPATQTAQADTSSCTYEHVIGSNLPKRTCLSGAQRDQLAREAQEKARANHRRATAPAAGGIK